METGKLRKLVYTHFRNGMRVFPWRTTRDPYRILVSEVMLQQTQAPRVVEKYNLFVKTFPNFRSLAKAPVSKVLKVWQGLGYNRRALALSRLARAVVREHEGKLPRDERKLMALPGVGPYTARAVLVFAYGEALPFIETNIRTVFIHFFFKGRKKVRDGDIMPLVEKTLDRKSPRKWYFALMDYGVFLKKTENASRRSAHYAKQSPFKGSHREVRGKIVKLLLEKKKIHASSLPRLLKEDKKNVARAAAELMNEGFIRREKRNFKI